MTDETKPSRRSTRGAWLCVIIIALGVTFYLGLSIGSKMVEHRPVPTPTSGE